jgi:hypothetical protein
LDLSTNEAINKYRIDGSGWANDGSFSQLLPLAFPPLAGYPVNMLQTINIDNCLVQYLPDGKPPVEKNELIISIGENKQKLEFDIYHGDLIQVDPNYRIISKGYFRTSGGTPTTIWNYRDGGFFVTSFFDILNSNLSNFYSIPRMLLTGTLDFKGVRPSFRNCYFEQRTGNKYVNNSFSFNEKIGEIEVEIIEIERGGGLISDPLNQNLIFELTDPNGTGEFTTEFSTEFVS